MMFNWPAFMSGLIGALMGALVTVLSLALLAT